MAGTMNTCVTVVTRVVAPLTGSVLDAGVAVVGVSPPTGPALSI
jgi:hypothetical protein